MTAEGPAPQFNPAPLQRAKRSFLAHPVAWVVLAISLTASAGGWFISWKNAELRARKHFDEETGKIVSKLTERMQIYEDVLHGALGLFSASYSVERTEWRTYLQSVSIEKRFPGIDGVGFLASVPREKLEDFLKTTREDKTPEFTLKDIDGWRSTNDLMIVKYIEPEERHKAMLGWNIGVGGERRAVAEQARDTGRLSMTGSITLWASAGNPQEGCMMMLPVYQKGMPTATVEQRRAAIEGWVFARFITVQLMKEVIGDENPYLHLQIEDQTQLGTSSGKPQAPTQATNAQAGVPKVSRLVFDSDPQLTKRRPQSEALFITHLSVRFGGRTWALSFAPTPQFEAEFHRGPSMWVAAAGISMSLLLFGIAWSLSHTRERALAMAAEMTRTLRDANKWLDHERYLLRTLMDNLPDHIYFKDGQSRFLRNSLAHLRAFGLSRPEDLKGKTDFDFFSREHAQQAYDDEQLVMKTGEPVTKEEKETWLDGSVSWVWTTKMPLRDESGNIIGTFGISHDITDRKRAEETMREAKEAAEEASRVKSQFLASMSHELRTPLNSVIGFANILLKNKSGSLGPAELNFLDRIQANGKHLLALINEILDLSKIEARKTELQIGPVNLNTLVRETVAQQEGLVRDKPVKLIADLPPQVAGIQTDAEKVRQILVNLIGNALKFTEQGSVTVRVTTNPETHAPLCIDVVDTGIGIPADKLKVIFEAFQQGEAGTSRKYGGTGLGLTISEALCKLLGFHISVTSEVGHGSTFSVNLAPDQYAPESGAGIGPAEAKTAARGDAQDKIFPAKSDKIRGPVLVIDDELDSRTLLTHAVEELGCHAIAADSGEQGLHMAREFRPALITVDLMMPGLDGFHVIRAIKADPNLRNIPVVVVSIVASEHRGKVLGAVDILQKPVSRSELAAVLRRCLPLSTPRVLIVDDEADARHLLAEHLKEEHCAFETASNGREALELLPVFSPDLILLDLVMPEMDGMTFLNHIRSLPQYLFLPVVVVTARQLSPAETEQLRQTVQDVVEKGENFEADLDRVLRQYLRGDGKKARAGSSLSKETGPAGRKRKR